jgi:hypothetical protein
MSGQAEVHVNAHTENDFSEKVRIFIRSPTISLADDFAILATPESTVLSLKQAIHERVSQKPNVCNQKLIYRGRLLKDSDRVIDLVGDGMENDQIFHLVVTPSTVNVNASRPTVSSGFCQEQFTTRFRHRQSDNATGRVTNSSPGLEASQSATEMNNEETPFGADIPFMQNASPNFFPDATQLSFGQQFTAAPQGGFQQVVVNYPIQVPFGYPMHYVLIK